MKVLLWLVPLVAAALIVAFALGLLEPTDPSGPEGPEIPFGGGAQPDRPGPRVEEPGGSEFPIDEHWDMTEEEILALPRVAVQPEQAGFPPPLPGGRRRPSEREYLVTFEGKGRVTPQDVLDAFTKRVFLRVRDPLDLEYLQQIEADDAWRKRPPMFHEVVELFRGAGFDIEDLGHLIVLSHPGAREGVAPHSDEPR